MKEKMMIWTTAALLLIVSSAVTGRAAQIGTDAIQATAP
jgi:hypothetical protein